MSTPQFTPEQRVALADAIYSGQKIEAIKQLRAASGLGLKDAKDVVERLENELRAEHPERFSASAKKSGCTAAAVLILLVTLLLLGLFQR